MTFDQLMAAAKQRAAHEDLLVAPDKEQAEDKYVRVRRRPFSNPKNLARYIKFHSKGT